MSRDKDILVHGTQLKWSGGPEDDVLHSFLTTQRAADLTLHAFVNIAREQDQLHRLLLTRAVDAVVEQGVASLPVAQRRNSDGEPDKQCSICLAPLEPSERLRLACGHEFHKDCISQWISRQAGCPLCRQTVAAESQAPLLEEAVRKFTQYRTDRMTRTQEAWDAMAAAQPYVSSTLVVGSLVVGSTVVTNYSVSIPNSVRTALDFLDVDEHAGSGRMFAAFPDRATVLVERRLSGEYAAFALWKTPISQCCAPIKVTDVVEHICTTTLKLVAPFAELVHNEPASLLVRRPLWLMSPDTAVRSAFRERVGAQETTLQTTDILSRM